MSLNNQKQGILVVSIIIVLFTLGLIYYVYQNDKNTKTSNIDEVKLSAIPIITNKSTVEPSETTTTSTETIVTTTETQITTSETTQNPQTNENYVLIENSKRNYDFYYPKEWTIATNEDDYIVLKTSDSKVNFQFRSDMMTNFGLPEYSNATTKTISLDGQDVVVYYVENPNNKLAYTKFSIGEMPYLILYSYPKDGNTEEFEKLIGTVNFK